MTGKKDFVLFKVLDGHVHGRLGRCPLDGGKLKFMEDDYETVHCSGVYDESSQIRMPCSFMGKRMDSALRLKPFYTHAPTEEENDEMDKQSEAVMGPPAEDSKAGKALIAAADDYEWDLESPAGIKKAAAQLVDLVEDKVDLPGGRDPKRLLGQTLMSNKDKGIQGVIEEIISKFGLKEAKEAKKAAKEEATKKVCANPKNASLLLAFQELAEFYFKGKSSCSTCLMYLVLIDRTINTLTRSVHSNTVFFFLPEQKAMPMRVPLTRKLSRRSRDWKRK